MEIGNALFGNSRGTNKVNRAWQNDFADFLFASGFNGYGCPDTNTPKGRLLENKYQVVLEDENGEPNYQYETDTFIVVPYYWGDDLEMKRKPNFVYKPTGFTLNWYKYPLRDSYMNEEISKEAFLQILEVCRVSVQD